MPQFESMQVPPRLPLVVETSNRSNDPNIDARLINCYIETTSNGELNIYRRPCLGVQTVIAAALPGRGLFFWRGDVYAAFSNRLYRNGVLVSSALDTTVGGTSGNGVYSFNEILGAIPKMVLGNGAKAYAYTVAGGLTADLHTIDTDYPIVTVKGFAYLNGATYVMQTQSVIWGSVVNSVSVPGDWDPLDFISAQIEPDDGVFMAKQLVYVIAFGKWSTEVFFDAGNPTGSPLGPVQGSKISYGCANQDTVQSIDDKLIWMCTNRTASLQFGILDQLSFTIISTKSIDKLLRGIDITTMYSWQLKIDGHSFYVVTFKEGNLTLAYDIVENLWFQWTDVNGDYFPIVASTYDASNNHIVQHESNGSIYTIGTEFFKDVTDSVQADIYTPNFDAGTSNSKTLNRMIFIGDQVEGLVFEVRNSDDDYKTWNSPRKVDMGLKKKSLTNCGSFTKRAYNFRNSQDLFFRLQAVDVQYDIGTL